MGILKTPRQALAAALFFAVAAAVPLGAQRSLEYEVKAAFLYNFVQFVEWPPESFKAPVDPFRLCLYGDDPFGPLLERTVGGDAVDGHPIVIERVPVDTKATQCHLIFIPQSHAARGRAVLHDLGGGPVLTIGESPNFLRDEGIINFVVEGGRVRFDVNVAVAIAHGLKISSKLLRVARSTSTGWAELR